MVLMPKVYKKGDKLVINLPDELIDRLKLKAGDILEFREDQKGEFTAAKKAETAGMPTEEELQVLRKLDALRYNVRTPENVSKELSEKEANVLGVLLKKGYASIQKSKKDSVRRYSIQDQIYDTYLMRKRQGEAAGQKEQKPQKQQAPQIPQPATAQVQQAARQTQQNEIKADMKEMIALRNTGEYGDRLEKKGYLVLGNSTEAEIVSAALEASIRQGYVVGVRAFNKKYYVVLKSFVYSNLPRVLAMISDKAMRVDDISRETGIESDGVRAILYIASENGDVTELKRDFFRIA
ncbi:MAG: hypothetical protein M1500_00190 [Candidatus Marsarchaeota archaeon]|jgi:bifunctional DNA-binding transcriptional regulator/antitoxin component of YhaV-PrlF toxin-antitoxin module|nr:hypothetical protein [Candidatus Marsarchaeota archaeon]